jgi:hypothetical protein
MDQRGTEVLRNAAKIPSRRTWRNDDAALMRGAVLWRKAQRITLPGDRFNDGTAPDAHVSFFNIRSRDL